jgi:hypothetical protein
VRKILKAAASLLVPLALGLVWLSRDKLRAVDPMAGDEAAVAIATIEQRAGHPLRAIDLTIDHTEVRAEIQNGTMPEVTDLWTYSHSRGFHGLIDWHHVSGPSPIRTETGDMPVSKLAFDLKDVDFAAVPRIAAAAIERVALREPGAVTRMSLVRPRVMGLQARIGKPRWRVEVASAHESAGAYADISGKVYGLDLTGTLRAQSYDLFSDNRALLDAAHALSDAFDGKERLRGANISSKSITFKVVRPDDAKNAEEWFADINGARRGTFQSPIPDPFPHPEPSFSTGDVDWAALVRLGEIARRTLEMRDGEIRMVDIMRDPSTLGPPSLNWAFYLRAGDGSEGRVALDQDGTVRGVTWPPRREAEKRVNMLTPERMAGFLTALRARFASGTLVMELVFLPDEARAILRDPDSPKGLTHLVSQGFGLSRSSMPPEPPSISGGGRDDLFDLGAIRGDDMAALTALRAAALTRLAIKDGTVSAIGIGRHRDILSRAAEINVEIDVAGADRKSGRYYADFHGHVLRVDEP